VIAQLMGMRYLVPDNGLKNGNPVEKIGSQSGSMGLRLTDDKDSHS